MQYIYPLLCCFRSELRPLTHSQRTNQSTASPLLFPAWAPPLHSFTEDQSEHGLSSAVSGLSSAPSLIHRGPIRARPLLCCFRPELRPLTHSQETNQSAASPLLFPACLSSAPHSSTGDQSERRLSSPLLFPVWAPPLTHSQGTNQSTASPPGKDKGFHGNGRAALWLMGFSICSS